MREEERKGVGEGETLRRKKERRGEKKSKVKNVSRVMLTK